VDILKRLEIFEETFKSRTNQRLTYRKYKPKIHTMSIILCTWKQKTHVSKLLQDMSRWWKPLDDISPMMRNEFKTKSSKLWWRLVMMVARQSSKAHKHIIMSSKALILLVQSWSVRELCLGLLHFVSKLISLLIISNDGCKTKL
jgi:hypothetical protein